jgi:N-methylhydantoinase B
MAHLDPKELDPISLQIIWSGLESIVDETFIALMKSAYSTNVKERRDHSTAIMDLDGRLVAQAAQSLPIHLASMSGLMQRLLEKFGTGKHVRRHDRDISGGTAHSRRASFPRR